MSVDARSIELVQVYTWATAQRRRHRTTGCGISGNNVLIVWMDGSAQSGGSLIARHMRSDGSDSFEQVIGAFGAEPTATRPDVASDGQRYVVVWRTRNAQGDYDVVGASMDRDNLVTPLSIAMSSADERDPSVIAVGSGRFLIAYEKIAADERRLAGRLLDFQERRRAIPHHADE